MLAVAPELVRRDEARLAPWNVIAGQHHTITSHGPPNRTRRG